MSSGQTHSGASIGAAIVYSVGYYSGYIVDPYQVPLISLGVFTSAFISPDMDVDGGNISNYYMRRIGGAPLDFLWSTFWTPYAISFRHRSFASHFPIVGTLFRVAYIFLPIIVVMLGNQKSPVPFWLLLSRTIVAQLMALTGVLVIAILLQLGVDVPYYALPLVCGIAIGDAIHFIMDHLL